MKGLWRYLRPFSPDTSGFCAVVNGTDGIGILDDPQGCAMNYLAFEETREGPERVFRSKLTNMDVVFGSERCIFEAYEESGEAFAPKFVLFGCGPASALTGTDLDLVSEHFTARYGVPSAPTETTGFQNYDMGVSAALCAMAKLLVRPKTRQPGSVNLLGCCFLDGGAGTERAARRWAEAQGLSVVSVWGGNATAAELSNAAAAEKNVVLSADAVPLARYMRNNLGISFEAGYPLGGRLRGFSEAPAGEGCVRCLIVGEQFISNAVRDYLETELRFPGVAVASFFRMQSEYMRPGDTALKSETDFTELLERLRPEVCVCDPELAPLLPPDVKKVPLPHRAVSGKRYVQEFPEPSESSWLELLQSSL